MYKRNLLCSFCEKFDETFHHIFNCDSGPYGKQSVKDLINCSSGLSSFSDLHRVAKFLVKYQKQRRFGHERNLLLLLNAHLLNYFCFMSFILILCDFRSFYIEILHYFYYLLQHLHSF